MIPTKATLRYRANVFDLWHGGAWHECDPSAVPVNMFVNCAVTGKPITLPALRYWSVELQEPYVDAVAATKRYAEWRAGGFRR